MCRESHGSINHRVGVNQKYKDVDSSSRFPIRDQDSQNSTSIGGIVVEISDDINFIID